MTVLDRMMSAVEDVRDRLLRATAALAAAGVSYAVVGGNAVAAHVAMIDQGAVRNTRDVDILLRRADLPAATAALEAAGFVYRRAAGIDMFLDGPDAKARDGVHVLVADERVREQDLFPTPGVEESEATEHFRVISLEALVCIKLNVYRRKDQVHLQDMIGVGLIDETWPARLPPVLGERLQTLLDDPDG